MRSFMILACFLLLACKVEDKDRLTMAMESSNEKISEVVKNLPRHEVQILYTEVNRTEGGEITFTDHEFQVDDSLYFYPASSVKFPIALLALEKLNVEEELGLNTKFYIEGDSLETTFAREIEKIFAVSDNEAYNKLFEFLGQDEINERLLSKGIKARISHRLSTSNSGDITTKPLIYYLNDSTSTTTLEIINKPLQPLKLRAIQKGLGHKEGDSLIMEPKDFSLKNYLPLRSLHKMMKQLMFPGLYSKEQQFQLSENDRDFLLTAMKSLPKDAGYNSAEYYDSYVKFFVYGDSKEPIPKEIEIYNKVGYAYGYLTDCAYIIDRKTDMEYIITATIHVNENRIFNDDNYEYESIGIPFLAELGRQLVQN